MGWFSKKVTLEAQLKNLEALGFALGDNATFDDLFLFGDREALEAAPYKSLVETMAQTIEREPESPICDRLWMCDFERIEDHGDYADVLVRLERMTGGVVGLSEIQDHVGEDGTWVSFVVDEQPMRWDLAFDTDWLDPRVFALYAGLLEREGAPLGLYMGSNHEEYGQEVLLVVLDPSFAKPFGKLVGIPLQPVA
tara:strand:+ start:2675 stop:3259 length:585 start_codon:yes stop_codon:yes gene_type:complete